MNSANKTYPCTSCDKSYTTQRRLHRHSTFSHSPPDPQLSCQICNKTLYDKKNLQKHKNIFQHYTIDDVITPKTKEFMCELCNFQTDLENDLENHYTSSHFPENPSDDDNLLPHLLLSATKGFECPYKNCLAKTFSKDFMRQHFRTVHCSDEAFYNYLQEFAYNVCKVCNQKIILEEFMNHTRQCVL